MDLPFRLVDVFTDRPLSGNQLCVVPHSPQLTDEQMLALAREIGFSETTFVTESGRDRYAMRIFTPDGELPFAGHPTLGTAFVLVSEGTVRSPAIQRVPAGDFAVEVDVGAGTASVRQHAPTFGPEPSDRDAVARAVGLAVGDLHPELPPQSVSTGLAHLLIPVRTPELVATARRDGPRLATVLNEVHAKGSYLFALAGDGAKARMFDPGDAIGEDPATGSAAGPLAAYLAERGVGGMPGRLVIRQGAEVGRPSVLVVDVAREGDHWAVDVSGGVRIVGHGVFHVPFEPQTP
jgi:trans-2,3-dihydro-3-hydroxyanthranilate isomerase